MPARALLSRGEVPNTTKIWLCKGPPCKGCTRQNRRWEGPSTKTPFKSDTFLLLLEGRTPTERLGMRGVPFYARRWRHANVARTFWPRLKQVCFARLCTPAKLNKPTLDGDVNTKYWSLAGCKSSCLPLPSPARLQPQNLRSLRQHRFPLGWKTKSSTENVSPVGGREASTLLQERREGARAYSRLPPSAASIASIVPNCVLVLALILVLVLVRPPWNSKNVCVCVCVMVC